jgi:hypothetical protein
VPGSLSWHIFTLRPRMQRRSSRLIRMTTPGLFASIDYQVLHLQVLHLRSSYLTQSIYLRQPPVLEGFWCRFAACLVHKNTQHRQDHSKDGFREGALGRHNHGTSMLESHLDGLSASWLVFTMEVYLCLSMYALDKSIYFIGKDRKIKSKSIFYLSVFLRVLLLFNTVA